MTYLLTSRDDKGVRRNKFVTKMVSGNAPLRLYEGVRVCLPSCKQDNVFAIVNAEWKASCTRIVIARLGEPF